MAVTTPVAGGQGAASAAAVAPARGETALRLAGAQLLTLALTLFVAGAAWDIQWHPSVGRDRVLSSPHVLLLAGMALSGLLSLALILIDSWRARRGPAVGQHNSTLVLGVFHIFRKVLLLRTEVAWLSQLQQETRDRFFYPDSMASLPPPRLLGFFWLAGQGAGC